MTRIPKVPNSEAFFYVRDKEDFDGSSMYGRRESDKLYVVYSYGIHFPMYAFDTDLGKWVGNTDKWSRTTTVHQSQTKPTTVDYWFDTDEMKQLARAGSFTSYMAKKMGAKIYGNS